MQLFLFLFLDKAVNRGYIIFMATRKGAREMTIDKIKTVLNEIGIGMTSVKWDFVVTRWSNDVFEINTYGKEKNTHSLDDVAEIILKSID